MIGIAVFATLFFLIGVFVGILIAALCTVSKTSEEIDMMIEEQRKCDEEENM